jgi:predicted HAD superfamily phosphohydrolase
MIVNLKEELIDKIDRWFNRISDEELRKVIARLNISYSELINQLFDLEEKSVQEVIVFYNNLEIKNVYK